MRCVPVCFGTLGKVTLQQKRNKEQYFQIKVKTNIAKDYFKLQNYNN